MMKKLQIQKLIIQPVNSLSSFMLEDWRTGLPYLDILGNPQVLKDGLHGVGQIILKI